MNDPLVTIRHGLKALGLPHKENDVRLVRQRLKRRGLLTTAAGQYMVRMSVLREQDQALRDQLAAKEHAESVERSARELQKKVLDELAELKAEVLAATRRAGTRPER